MLITYTKHALEQMKNRKISNHEVKDTLNNPIRIIHDKFGNFIAQKLVNTYLIRVVYREEVNTKIVVTVYRTSKISKYT